MFPFIKADEWLAWQKFSIESWALWMEANAVIGLRMLRLAQGGPAAGYEAERMVTEKFSAFGEAAMRYAFANHASGGSSAARSALVPIRRQVQANRRRLGRAKRTGTRG